VGTLGADDDLAVAAPRQLDVVIVEDTDVEVLIVDDPRGCQEIKLASVTPYAALKVATPKRWWMTDSTSTGMGAAPMTRRLVLASGVPERGISGRSMSWARRYAMVPNVEVMVAPVRFISDQKLDTEKRR
jgi:hypothetical protein